MTADQCSKVLSGFHSVLDRCKTRIHAPTGSLYFYIENKYMTKRGKSLLYGLYELLSRLGFYIGMFDRGSTESLTLCVYGSKTSNPRLIGIVKRCLSKDS